MRFALSVNDMVTLQIIVDRETQQGGIPIRVGTLNIRQTPALTETIIFETRTGMQFHLPLLLHSANILPKC